MPQSHILADEARMTKFQVFRLFYGYRTSMTCVLSIVTGLKDRDGAIFVEVVRGRSGGTGQSCINQGSDCESLESHAKKFTIRGTGMT